MVLEESETNEVFTANITHNLGIMAREAGIYHHLWRPDELDITKAQGLIEPLTLGLDSLRRDRARFERFNPENGWGDYDGLVSFVESYLQACMSYPDADVRVWR